MNWENMVGSSVSFFSSLCVLFSCTSKSLFWLCRAGTWRQHYDRPFVDWWCIKYVLCSFFPFTPWCSSNTLIRLLSLIWIRHFFTPQKSWFYSDKPVPSLAFLRLLKDLPISALVRRETIMLLLRLGTYDAWSGFACLLACLLAYLLAWNPVTLLTPRRRGTWNPVSVLHHHDYILVLIQ